MTATSLADGARPVKLYVYDLSRGMARQFSQPLIGRHIDAVYHTSIVIGTNEIFYGYGIQYARPGSTHHGAPMEVIDLGNTGLPDEVIHEYLGSMKEIYTPEAYDLFMNNCNNFTNDFAMFLVGKGIPDHITSLPKTVLDTPFGQMLRPTLESAIRPITTAPNVPSVPQPAAPAPVVAQPSRSSSYTGVRVISNLREFDNAMASAKNSAAAVFFTSAGCPPCRMVYPHFEQLAAEVGTKAVFIKVDVSIAFDVGSKYQIRATPTFTTFIKGEKLDEWTGANPGTLKSNVNMMLSIAYPPHPHSNLRLPLTLSVAMKPVTFTKIPPLDKVIAKMGDTGKDASVVAMKEFISERQSKGAREAPLPNLTQWNTFFQTCINNLPLANLFPVVDLFRMALVDVRVSGWFAEQDHGTLSSLLTKLTEKDDVPYSLRLVTLQALCNLFTTPLYPPQLINQPLSSPIVALITNSLLDTAHPQSRVAASSLAFNIAQYNQKRRSESIESWETRAEAMSSDDIVQLTAGIVEAIERESESAEALRGLVLSLAMLVYEARLDGEIVELVGVLDAGKIVTLKGKKSSKELLGDDAARLCKEVGEELLGRGLARK